MAAGSIVLVTGGVRSGKSQFAEEFTASFDLPVTYIATATVQDEEMDMRVKLHQQRRPATWNTVEEADNIGNAIAAEGGPHRVLLLDCLTFWITNLLCAGELPKDENSFKALEEAILVKVKETLQIARSKRANLVIVSNESGLGLIPSDRLSRKYQEIVGRANQLIAREADEVYLVVAGLPVEIKDKAKSILRRLGE